MLQLVLNHSRGFGGHEQTTSLQDIEVWRRISALYSEMALVEGDGSELLVTVDWSSRLRYEERYCTFFQRPRAQVLGTLSQFDFEHAHACPIKLRSTKGQTERHGSNVPALQWALYELYLIANLTAPGAFNLYRSYLRDTTLDPAQDTFAQTHLELSEYLFESAWHDAQDTNWLRVGFLPFDQLREWYLGLHLTNRGAATTDVQRTLYCLLHLGKTLFLEPTATLWLASALESLFDTPSGSAFTFLCQRAGALLELQPEQTTVLKKKMRAFFDIRNAFAHGGSVICHPLADERDKLVESTSRSTIDANNFACSILIGSLQQIIRRGWPAIRFEEHVYSA